MVLDARLVARVVIHRLLHLITLGRLALALDVGRGGVMDTLHLLVFWLGGHFGRGKSMYAKSRLDWGKLGVAGRD